jgi:hypothetical protein
MIFTLYCIVQPDTEVQRRGRLLTGMMCLLRYRQRKRTVNADFILNVAALIISTSPSLNQVYHLNT